jgi:hypothetical protein
LLQKDLLQSAAKVNVGKQDPAEEEEEGEGGPAERLHNRTGNISNTTKFNTSFIPLGKWGDLNAAIPLVLVNLTNLSGLMDAKLLPQHENVSHIFGLDPEADLSMLYEKVEGFFQILHEAMGPEDADRYCPSRNFGYIRRCIDVAMCIVQEDVPMHIELDQYALYTELLTRFDAITWDNIVSELANTSAVQNSVDHQMPDKYVCDETAGDNNDNASDTLESAVVNLIQSQTIYAKNADAQAATLAVSVALAHATKSTHAILDAHGRNSSMEATVGALADAWLHVCGPLQCDHTNYPDIFFASHGHSLALLQVGVSTGHLRAHIRNRVTLENRIQRFLAEHGESFAMKAYRMSETQAASQESMHQYLHKGRLAMRRSVLAYIDTLDNETKALRLVDRERLQQFKFDHADDYRASAGGDGAMLDVDDDVDESDSQNIALAQMETTGRRRRRRRRRCCGKILKAVGGAVGGAVSGVVDTFVDVAEGTVNFFNMVGDFIADLFECIGQGKIVGAVGYCKKFPAPTSNVGVGASFTASEGFNLLAMLQGNPPVSIAVGIGMVAGAVPGSPVTGGLRSGVGIGGKVACSGAGCSVGISVGAATSALFPVSNCAVGTWLGDFKCMQAAGVTVTILCCSFNLVTGSENCR